jgi:hypothetical protein
MTKGHAMSLDTETYIVETPICGMCGEQGVVEVPAVGFLQWNFGMLVQEAFPDVSLDIREQLISGTHPECWKKMVGE